MQIPSTGRNYIGQVIMSIAQTMSIVPWCSFNGEESYARCVPPVSGHPPIFIFSTETTMCQICAILHIVLGRSEYFCHVHLDS